MMNGKFPKKLRIVVGYPVGQNSYYYNNKRIQKGEAMNILLAKLCEAESKLHDSIGFKIEDERKAMTK